MGNTQQAKSTISGIDSSSLVRIDTDYKGYSLQGQQ